MLACGSSPALLCVLTIEHQAVDKDLDMSNIVISPAEMTEAVMLKDISISAFKGNFERYGYYPHGIESLEWHQDKI